jgi:hypothetical protein
MAGPVGTRLRRLEKRLGVAEPAHDPDDDDDAECPESEAILAEMTLLRAGACAPSVEAIAAEVARRRQERVAAEARARAAGEKPVRPRFSAESLLVLERMREEGAARRRARALEPGGAV